ncbi:double-strand break repair helicase AddA [Magnetospirillum gryphiswaldense]|uniref:DNA 3'-5' helicase n=1 Tax=Magnetospirillum gryphiswaldense TaxID=55518 RepID=A4TZS7_9PROT|nr:double-strand break repair helicase AddA [Magnetospirillum gryphiswaldense]AVM75019.1 ATP-dependent helicase/nuclease subunit A [Magnetospirillum gryphiswaldense MSR-1]AVM78922.1 ATP-dependent helicase/nuclease subunit A [Magnetospirillum gryphiswaldense]CAM76134.1 UvrD/REP helicase [Magnetospirillum gryphiswaldense MSR-1]
MIVEASNRQRQAADPTASVWVAASAGTGKTKVLTDRVLNLLLAGNAPHKLLCLTFTKAAAAEMSNRINAKLATWAVADDASLDQTLTELLGRPPTPPETIRARRLFAQVLDAPGGMHMETIHAFCQSLLRRFPLEAGIAPHFQVMDDRDAGELLDEAKEEVLTHARHGADAHLAAALDQVTRHVHETGFPDLLAELASDRGRLKRLLEREGGIDGAIQAMRTRLGLESGDTAETILAAACTDEACNAATLRQAVPILLNGAKTDQEKGTRLAAWLAAPETRAQAFAEYCLSVLTAKGEMRAKLVTNGLRDAHPWLEPALQAEAERLIRVNARLKAAQVAQCTAALTRLGHALLAAYEKRKQGRALMDYDDLILAARDLMARPGVAPWVLFKLDGGIDHVLIDEAQDTNPDQWAVVAALTGEFFAGLGARESLRTVFAVGDIKQSIYSFQRADPQAFDDMRKLFAHHVPLAKREWREVPLNLSFRSTRAVLDAVDAVFAGDGPGRDGVTDDDPDPRHLAFRQGQAGLVELWPPVIPRPADEIPAWKPPIERLRGDSPRTRLARLMAARIAAMIGAEILESQNRPIRAGDVLVLLRRRGGFVEDLVRELKDLKIPVAGADRMVLTEQMAVMDLMALGNFLLLPEDDLTLATVLKGPLVGLSEDELFRLAWNRGEASLWDTLKRKAGSEAAFARAEDYLSPLLALADRLAPFALFAHVLGKLGGKRALLARLGPEAEDPLDEFMALTMAFERGHPPSLQGFLRWLESGGTEIKRDLEQGGRDAVRIMTVHGSKGLQAPIVFMPDTLQMPIQGPRLLWNGGPEDEILLWPPRAEMADDICEAARAAQKLAREREYRRLLYVAMTRAEDRLYVCGWETLRAAPQGCWYNLIRTSLEPLAARMEDPFLAAAGETDDATVLRLTCRQEHAVEAQTFAEAEALLPALPAWARLTAPPEPAPPRPLAPSQPEGEEPPARSPLSSDGAGRFKRGKLVHKLLQILPDLPRDRRAQAAIRFLKGTGGLDTSAALAIANEVSDILDHAGFAPLFAPGSKAEVPIVGLIGESRALSGQVDRLVVTATEVLVADYKTNRRPPAVSEAIPDLYVRQMAAYRLALACIYPHHRIRCALVWTDGPALREIEPAALDDALDSMVG